MSCVNLVCIYFYILRPLLIFDQKMMHPCNVSLFIFHFHDQSCVYMALQGNWQERNGPITPGELFSKCHLSYKGPLSPNLRLPILSIQT